MFGGRFIDGTVFGGESAAPRAKSTDWSNDKPSRRSRHRQPHALCLSRLTNWTPRLPDLSVYRRRQDMINVKAYAHDRLVLHAYTAPPPLHARRAKKRDIARLVRGNLLELKRETQHGFNIGGRWRFVPPDISFTTKSKNNIRDAAHVQEMSGEGNCVFLTVTIPGGTDQAFKVCSAGSGYLVNRFNQRLRGECIDGMFCYTWELQERGAPHLHYMFRIRGALLCETFRARISDIWCRILDDVSEQTGIDLYQRKEGGTWREKKWLVQVDVRVVRRDFARYMAKYISKTRSKDGNEHGWRPGRWVGVSYPLRAKIAKFRFEVALPMRSLRVAIKSVVDIAVTLRQYAKSVKWCGGTVESAPTVLSVQAANGGGYALFKAVIDVITTGDTTLMNDYVRTFEPLLNTS